MALPRPSELCRAIMTGLLCAPLLTASCSNRMPNTPEVVVQVSGLIRDRDGAGVPDVDVVMDGLGPANRDYEHVTTDSTGSFTVDLAEGQYRVTIYPMPGSGLPYARLDRVSINTKSSRLDYRYTGILVQGSVLLPTGAGIDSGVVCFEHQGSGFGACSYVRNGSFKVLLPQAGTFEMRASSWAPALSEIPRTTFAVSADTTIEVRIEAVSVSGTIFGPNGTVLAGAIVSPPYNPYYYSVVSGNDGSYEIWVGGSGGRFLVRPPHDMRYILPHLTPFVTLSGPTTLDVNLDGSRWSGAVRSTADGSAVPGLRVTASLVADSYGRTAFDVTDGEGGFELILEPRKEYDFSVSNSTEVLFAVRSRYAGADSTFDVYVNPGAYGSPTP